MRLVLSRSIGLKLLHLADRQLARLTAPGLAQVVEQIGQLRGAELISEARHRLHAFETGELLFANAILDHSQQIARVFEAQGGIALHRYGDFTSFAA